MKRLRSAVTLSLVALAAFSVGPSAGQASSAWAGQVRENSVTLPPGVLPPALGSQAGILILNSGLKGVMPIGFASPDDHWRVIEDPLNSTNRPAIVVVNNYWPAPLSNSRWISASATRYEDVLSNLEAMTRSFRYSVRFNLPTCFSAPRLTMQLRADDLIREVVLNGIPIFTASPGQTGTFTGPPLSIPYSSNMKFQPANQLDVVVEDEALVVTGLNVAATVSYEIAADCPNPSGRNAPRR